MLINLNNQNKFVKSFLKIFGGGGKGDVSIYWLLLSIPSLSHGFNRNGGFLELVPYFLQDGNGTGRVPMDA